nr:hypothetical protein [Microbacterium testaceum]
MATVVVTPLVDQFDKSTAVTVNPDAVIVDPDGTETRPLRVMAVEVGDGDGVADGVGAGVAVAVGVTVRVGVGVTVRVGVGEGLALRVGVGEGLALRVGVGEGLALRVGVGDGLALRVGVGDGLTLRVGVGVGVGLAVVAVVLTREASPRSDTPVAAEDGVAIASGTTSATTVGHSAARTARRTDDFT